MGRLPAQSAHGMDGTACAEPLAVLQKGRGFSWNEAPGRQPFDQIDAQAKPSHDVDGHRVAETLVLRSVRASLGRSAAPRDAAPTIGEALQSAALGRRKTPNRHSVQDSRDTLQTCS